MRTRSSSNLHVVSPSNPSTSNPKRRNRIRSKQPFILEESPIDTMADQRTMAELLRAPTEGYKDLLCACPHHGFTELHQLDTFYNALNPTDQDSLNAAAGGNLLERRTQDVLTIIENKSKVRNSRNKSVVSQVKSCDANSNSSSEIAKLTHAVNQQTSVVTTAMTGILKQFQATPPPASVKAVEETCVTCGGAHPYYQCLAAGVNTFPELRDNIQGYVSAAAVNYNQGNSVYRPPEKVKRINEANMKAMQTQINMVKNDLRNEMKNSIQASLSNKTNEIKNMMASLFQMNTASTSGSGSLPSNTIANPKGKLKAITTRSGIFLDGPTVPIPLIITNPKVDERVEETLTDPDLSKYTIKVPPHPVQKYKPPSQREYVVCQKDPLHPNIPYPSRMLKQKQQEKDEVQIHKFWQMFKQLHINITFADALILIPKYQKMLKALLSNNEKLQELANTPLNEKCSAVILKKLPEKLSKLGLPELISTRMTLELANRAICTPAGIARDVFVLIGKFTFPADFVIVDYESDPRVPVILGRPFLRTARALIDVHGEEMILRDGDERLTLNMRHDTFSYSNQPRKESINLINVFSNSSEDFLEDLFSTNQPSGNPTFSSHPEVDAKPSTNNEYKVFNPGILSQENPFEIITRVVQDKKLSISHASLMLEDFDPPFYETFFFKEVPRSKFDVEFDLKETEFLLHQDIDSSLKDSINQRNLANLADNFIDDVPEMFTDEHALDYSSPPMFDEYDDDFLEVESDTENVYDDPFDSKGEKIKDSKLLIDELDLLCDFLPSKVDIKPSTNNEDKIFNPGILIQEKHFEIITHVVQDKKLAISNASSMLEDFDPPFYEPLFFKEVPRISHFSFLRRSLVLRQPQDEANASVSYISGTKKAPALSAREHSRRCEDLPQRWPEHRSNVATRSDQLKDFPVFIELLVCDNRFRRSLHGHFLIKTCAGLQILNGVCSVFAVDASLHRPKSDIFAAWSSVKFTDEELRFLWEMGGFN
uniref:Reverse transcriptase domain-containing protein n=1 Tax=Tanacetum cinerariifolium TaxID=118510 RepID=A0A6L2J665_TANCI|nr:hypothetical protein [Tanacetum cinerariifolium]